MKLLYALNEHFPFYILHLKKSKKMMFEEITHY